MARHLSNRERAEIAQDYIWWFRYEYRNHALAKARAIRHATALRGGVALASRAQVCKIIRRIRNSPKFGDLANFSCISDLPLWKIGKALGIDLPKEDFWEREERLRRQRPGFSLDYPTDHGWDM